VIVRTEEGEYIHFILHVTDTKSLLSIKQTPLPVSVWTGLSIHGKRRIGMKGNEKDI
jgi:hypothetical protein